MPDHRILEQALLELRELRPDPPPEPRAGEEDPGPVERMDALRRRDRIGARVHAAQLVDLRTAVFTDPLELHEGALRYYRSVKP